MQTNGHEKSYHSPYELVSICTCSIEQTTPFTRDDLTSFLLLQFRIDLNSYLAFCTTDNILIYNLHSVKIYQTIPRSLFEHDIKILFFLNSHELVIASEEVISIWDTIHERFSKSINPDIRGINDCIASEKTIVFCNNLNLGIWNTSSNVRKSMPMGVQKTAIIQVSVYDDKIVTGHVKLRFVMWSLDLEIIQEVEPLGSHHIYSFGMWNETSIIVCYDNSVHIYDLYNKQVVLKVPKVCNDVYCVRKGFRNKIVFIDHFDGFELKIVDIVTASIEYGMRWKLDGVYRPFSMKGSLLVFSKKRQEVTVLDMKTMTEVNRIVSNIDHKIDLCIW